MIAFICEVIQFLWTLALFVGSIVFLALTDANNLNTSGCKRSRYNRPLIFSIIVLFFILFFNVSSIRYRWHMKVRRERTRQWFQDVAKRKLQGALHLKRMGPNANGGGQEGLEADGDPHGEPANFPPRPRQQPFKRHYSSSSWEIFFMAAQWVATIYLSWCYSKASMDLCGQQSPKVKHGVYIINVLQWCHLLFGWIVRPLARAYSNRKNFLHAPLRVPAPEERPAFVQLVCYVPSLEEYRDVPLPHPPVQLDAENADCPICYDEFAAPTMHRISKAIKRSKTLTVTAPTLWRTRCGHVFHNSCLLEWLRASGGTTCPYCNQDAATAPERQHAPEHQQQPTAGVV